MLPSETHSANGSKSNALSVWQIGCHFFLHHAVTKNAWSNWMLDLRPGMNMLSTQFKGAENDGEVRFSLKWSFSTSNKI